MTPDELDEIERTITGVDAAYGPGEQRTEMHRLITALREAWAKIQSDAAVWSERLDKMAAQADRNEAGLVAERDEARAEVERLQRSLNCIMCSTPMQVTTRIHTCPSCRTGHVEQLRDDPAAGEDA